MTVWANSLVGLKETFVDAGEGWDCYSTKDEIKRMRFVEQWAGENIILANFIKLIHKLSINFPGKNFVLRPHPGEDIELYKTVFSGVKNIFVVKKGAVSQWIMASELVIHDGCTTAIESFLAEVLVINYKSIDNYSWESVMPNQFGIQCKTETEVIKAINEIQENTKSLAKENSLTPLTSSLMRNLHANVYDEFITICEKTIKEKMKRNARDKNLSIFKMTYKEFSHSIVLSLKKVTRAFFPSRRIKYSAGRVFFQVLTDPL
jgi:hypothetical protein